MQQKHPFSFLTVLAWFAVTFLIGCQQNNSVPETFKSADSTWKKVEHALEVDSIGYKGIPTYLYEVRTKSIEEINWIASKMEAHPDWDDNDNLKTAVSLMRTWYYFEKHQDSLALLQLNSINTNQIDLQLSAIQEKALYFHFNNFIDSARALFTKSFQIAKAQENHHWILQSANNAGTLYYDIEEYEIASEYFTEALKSASVLKIKVPMLINNIITCSLVDAKPEEALNVFKKYSPIFKPSDDYERAIYDLNKIHLFWGTNQIDSFKYYLDRLNITDLGELFEAKRDLHYLYYYSFTNDISRFAELFSKYRKQITSNPNEFLIQWCALLAYAQSKGMPIFNYQELIQLYNNPSIAANKKLKSNLSYLLYQNRKGTAEGDKWRIERLNLELDIQSSEALTFQNNLKTQLKMNELYDENNKIKLKMELDSTEKTVYIITLIGTILVSLLGGISFLFFQKNRKNAIQKLQLELQNNRNINELNQNKKQFAERLISANQAINKKLDKIASKLKQSNFGKDPEIIQIRRELEGITEIKDDWGNELNQIKAIDGIKFLIDYFQSVQLFNQTEQTLLAYFINGHKVKEIATLMNLSEQHVRNTKTKVLKTLSQEHQTEVSIEQLIELKVKGLI
jgi:DNA-binding CsgD family transcriptional regulator